MNKKVSTLVAGLLLATSFGASAQMTLSSASSSVDNGGKYFLYNATSGLENVLGVSGDSLKIFSKTDLQNMSKVEREKALWTLSYSQPTGATSPVWKFVNDSTSKTLTVGTSGKAFAVASSGNATFAWQENVMNTSAGCNLTFVGSDGKTYVIMPCFITQKKLAGDNSNNFGKYREVAKEAYGYGGVHVFEYVENRANSYDPTKMTYISTHPTEEEIAAGKAMVALIDAKLAEYGLHRDMTELAKYKAWANEIEGLTTTATTNSNAALNSAANAKTELGNCLAVCDYGFAGKKNGLWEGILAVANKTNKILLDENEYAAGTVLIDTELGTFAPAVVGNSGLGTTSATVTAGDVGENISNVFANEFRIDSEQKDSLVTIGLDITGANTPAITGVNPFKSAQIQLVKAKILLSSTTGKSIKSGASLSNTDFTDHWMIYDRSTGKYLWVSHETYNDDPMTGMNFKLDWVDLKDLTSKVGSAATGMFYYNLKTKEHIGSAAFKVSYNPQTYEMAIAPEWLYQMKGASAAVDTAALINCTIIDNSGSNYILGLKKFGSSVELTTVNADGSVDPVYPIYASNVPSRQGWTEATVENDVNFIQYISGVKANKDNNEKYLSGLADGATELVKGEKADLNVTPEAQWAVTTDDNGVSIVNRATGKPLVFNSRTYTNVTLCKASALKASDTYVTLVNGDTLKLTSVDTKYKMDSTLGYFAYDSALYSVSMKEEKFKLAYYNNLDSTLCLGINKDNIVYVDKNGEGEWFEVVPAESLSKYGSGAVKDAEDKVIAKQLYKTNFNLKVKIGDTKYTVGTNAAGKYAIGDNTTAAKFEIKEMAHQASCWYILKDITNATTATFKASVDDRTLELFKEDLGENRTSLFALVGENYAYRNIGKDTTYVEFYMAKEPTRFLYENSQNRVANNGTKVAADSLCFLGVYNKADLTRNASIFVDTAYVRNDTVKPLYMLAVDAVYTPDTTVEQVCTVHKVKDGHGTKVTEKANITGRYLVSLADSTENASAKFEGATRLAFVPATHVGDNLIIASSKYAAKAATAGEDTLNLAKVGTMNAATFAFELVDSQDADGDFYMQNGDGYVRIENGVPVLTDTKDKAATFNIKKSEVVPTANETVAAEGVKVIAGEGFVTVKGAAGKKVVIANVLGQTVANTVIASDEAQIAAPAGVVIVAVEGEAAVKAIVK